MFFKRLSMAASRCLKVFSLKASPSEKILALSYVFLFYSLRILNRFEFRMAGGRLPIDHGRIILTDLNIRTSIYHFMEFFLDDCYSLAGHDGEKVAVVDLGANTGILLPALFYYGWRPVCYVGVEPVERNFRKLAETARLFMKPGDFLLVKRAIARTGGKTKVFHDCYGMSRSIEFLPGASKGLKTAEVRTISFPGLMKTVNARFKKLKAPILLKLDMEGGEWESKDAIISFLRKERRARHFRGELHSISKEKTAEIISKGLARRLKGVFDFEIKPTEVMNSSLIFGERIQTKSR